MNIIEPFAVTDATLISTNVAENDRAEWDNSTTFNTGDYTMVTGTTHKIYRSAVDSNLGNDPTTDDGTNWVEQGATNRWKAFDQRLLDPVTNDTSIEYEIVNAGRVEAVALFNLSSANIATITLTDETVSPAVEVYSEEISLVDNSVVMDWYSYFFEDISYETGVILDDLPPYAGATLSVVIEGDSGDTVSCGQIVFGKKRQIGATLLGTGIGIDDYSRKERDDFGNAILLERAFSSTVNFTVAVDAAQAKRISTILSGLRATPAVYYADAESEFYGATIYGFYQDFFIPINAPTKTKMTIEIQGLT